MSLKQTFLPAAAALLITSFAVPASRADAVYTVSDEAPTLGEIALRLYGSTRMWKEIASWNGLQAPFRIQPGQKLTLKESPRLSAKEGARMLLTMWRQRLGVEIETPSRAIAAIDPSTAPHPATSSAQLTAWDHLRLGEHLIASHQEEEALEHFRKSRDLNEAILQPWFRELQILRHLKREEERESLQSALLEKHPELRVLPMFQPKLE